MEDSHKFFNTEVFPVGKKLEAYLPGGNNPKFQLDWYILGLDCRPWSITRLDLYHDKITLRLTRHTTQKNEAAPNLKMRGEYFVYDEGAEVIASTKDTDWKTYIAFFTPSENSDNRQVWGTMKLYIAQQLEGMYHLVKVKKYNRTR